MARPAVNSMSDDLVLDEDDLVAQAEDDDQPVFQTGGGDASMVAQEADKETASRMAQDQTTVHYDPN